MSASSDISVNKSNSDVFSGKLKEGLINFCGKSENNSDCDFIPIDFNISVLSSLVIGLYGDIKFSNILKNNYSVISEL